VTRPFLPWPDKRLRDISRPVDAITDEIRALWDEMIEIMEAMPGYGLAAPQIGVFQRLAVVDCSDERGRVVRLANPEIVARSDETFTYEEASPNLPGVSAKVTRPARVAVSFLDADGDQVRQDFEDVWATSVQHQIDHLNGKLYFDRLSRTRREMLLKKARKL
jgi:peptide deformylase